jgi:hypothetical protein
MKKIHCILVILILQSVNGYSQITIDQLFNTVGSATGSGLSNSEITQGLKEALTVGSKNATASASKTDGYFKNPKIKIPWPSEARDMKSTLNSLGMKKQVTAFEKQINRAAEDAAKKAAPIFIRSITSMTINDGVNILKGKNDEATQYLKRTTTDQLMAEFKPVVSASLKKVEITKYWKPLFSSYNQVPGVKKVNPNLDEYVSRKAMEGLFKLIAEEELKIRQDPSARVNEILKKVFGG